MPRNVEEFLHRMSCVEHLPTWNVYVQNWKELFVVVGLVAAVQAVPVLHDRTIKYIVDLPVMVRHFTGDEDEDTVLRMQMKRGRIGVGSGHLEATGGHVGGQSGAAVWCL